MRFTLSFASTLTAREDFADVKVFGLPEYHVFSFTAEKLLPPTDVEIREGALVELAIDVFFRKSGENVRVRADVKDASGLHIQQIADNLVLADILHTTSAPAAQCTVRCPATGDSRTGRNVCIECGTSRGMIKICC